MRAKAISVDEIVVGDRHRKDMGDLQRLAVSIETEGLLQPIGVTPDNELVFGERRLRAVKDILGWDRIDCVVVNVSSIAAGEYAENEIRKDFTVSERVAIAQAVAANIGNRQGKRTDLHHDEDEKEGQADDDEEGLQENFPEVEPGQQTRDVATERSGFGNPRTYQQAAKVVDKGAPELVEAMDAGLAPSIAAKVAELPKREQKKAAKAFLAGDKKAVREAITEPKSASQYPVSDKFSHSVNFISAFHTGLRKEHTTVAKLVKHKQWDKAQTADLARMLDAVTRSLTSLNTEMQSHVNGVT
jgi:ParB-like chromosome segregation protein Spo0J